MMTQLNARLGKAFDVQSVLEQVPLLSGLTPDERSKLADGLEMRDFRNGEALMEEGAEGDSFFIIVTGSVEVSTAKGGKIATLGESDYAGEQALLQSTRRNATLRAVAPTVCLVCSQKLFKQILAGNTQVKFAKREAKRNAFMTALDDDVKLDDVKTEKPQETVDWLLECVSTNLLFANLDMDQRTRVIQRMELVNVKKGQEVITQNDEHAHTFYVVESGNFDVLVDEVKVHQYERGGCFGELALLYDSPRAATVVATSDANVWEVERKAFRYEVTMFAKKKQNDEVEFLKQVKLFQPLLSEELSYLADALDARKYRKGDVIFKEGDEGDLFYIVKKGVCAWSKSDGQGGDIPAGGIFGERALRTREPRAATITAKTKCTLLEMSAQDFEALLGPVIDLIDAKIDEYHRSAEQQQEDKQKQQKRETFRAQQLKNAQMHLAERSRICGLKEFKYIGVLGKGGFGLVWLVQDPHTSKSYALKSIKKHQVIEFELQKHIVSEKKVMDMMQNKFLVNLHTTYKDPLRVYFLLDVCLGGELFTILRQKRYFNEAASRFYAACVVEGFDYMHSQDIIYRDLKPENLVLDTDGYLKITDFGFAKICPDKTFTLCGTPDYLCPEIVTGQGHGKGVDWWTLGILIYEMLASFPPFVADDPIDTYRKIIRGRIRFPRYFSQPARDLIRGLLNNKPTRRLGVLKGGAKNIRKHTWYKGFSWDQLRAGKMPAPIVNKVRDMTDLSNFAEVDPGDEEAKPVPPEEDFDADF